MLAPLRAYPIVSGRPKTNALNVYFVFFVTKATLIFTNNTIDAAAFLQQWTSI
ncbi:MAG: hypothetical protein H7Z11_18035 [Verrucomicrobia bacterium]|nr:hypothetical protein [Leptolyngbya sp. ES-bin-22]